MPVTAALISGASAGLSFFIQLDEKVVNRAEDADGKIDSIALHNAVVPVVNNLFVDLQAGNKLVFKRIKTDEFTTLTNHRINNFRLMTIENFHK